MLGFLRVALIVLTGLLMTTGIACSGPAEPGNHPSSGPIDAQGHRGARGLLPENTLAGFEYALELGVTTLELDLGMTRDGVLVVTHDPRVTPALCTAPDGSPIRPPGPLVRDLLLAEIQAFDCGSLNPDPARFPEPPRRAVPGARIPTLVEVLDLEDRHGDRHMRFNIEVKVVPASSETPPLEPFVASIVRVLQHRELLTRATLQSFDWQALAVGKRLEPRLRTVALLSDDTLEARWLAGLVPSEHDGILGLLQAADEFVDDFSPNWQILLPRFGRGVPIRPIQEAGFRVVPWTVNEEDTMLRLLSLGVDGIITDYPDRLLDLLRERGIPTGSGIAAFSEPAR
ncbi:MAG: glycerophosphodiester phosphodiesterase [bacterium]|nr:glycerophosphodiester phosphodiesterase [bacterium]